MAVLIFLKFLDFEQVSVDSEMPILGQAPRCAYKSASRQITENFGLDFIAPGCSALLLLSASIAPQDR